MDRFFLSIIFERILSTSSIWNLVFTDWDSKLDVLIFLIKKNPQHKLISKIKSIKLDFLKKAYFLVKPEQKFDI